MGPESAIRERILQESKITFAEFMDIALYHPDGGYYTDDSHFGAEGDYYTGPAVHPAFGALLAVQFEQMWRLLGRPSPFWVIELGAGTGHLARAVVSTAADLSDGFHSSLRYVELDRYARSARQRNVLGLVESVVSDCIPFRGLEGCIFSNELVDAMPVHRFQIVNGVVKEVFVVSGASGKLTEILDDPSTPAIVKRLAPWKDHMTDGYRGEVNLNTGTWMNGIAKALDRGFVITIDYGYEASEIYSASRQQGTLQTYYQHTLGSSPYQRVGRQDLTAHVDFTSIMDDGNAVGLRTLGLTTQDRFLRDLGIQDLMDRIRQGTYAQVERDANMRALLELIKPEGFGEFKVLVQERNTGADRMEDLIPPHTALSEIATPLLDTTHVPLLQGQYPHLTLELDDLWPFGAQDR